MTHTFKLTIPISAGMKSSLIPSQSSKGLGQECAKHCRLNEVANTATPHAKQAKSAPTSIESMQPDLAETQLALKQEDELFSNDKHGYINPTMRIASGLDLEIGNAKSLSVEGRNFFHNVHLMRVKKSYHQRKKHSPVVQLGMCDTEVHSQTGFIDENLLLK